MRQNPGSRGLLILAAARPAPSHGRLGGSGATCERRRGVPAATAMPTPGLPIPTFSPESPTTMLSPIGAGLCASSRAGCRAGRWEARRLFAAVSRRTNARSGSRTRNPPQTSGSGSQPLFYGTVWALQDWRVFRDGGRGAGKNRADRPPRAGSRRETQERARRRPFARPEQRQQRRTSATPALRSDWKHCLREYAGDRLKVYRRRKARCPSVRRLRQRAVNAVLAGALWHRGAERSRVGRIGEQINAAEAL